MKSFWLGVAAAACSMSCSVAYRMSVTSPTPVVAKPASCDFRVLNLPPSDGSYDEIGTLTPTAGRATTPEQFKDVVHASVCKIGGDVVVGEINAKGWYIRGTVLRQRTEAATAAPAAAAAVAAPAGAPAAAPAAASVGAPAAGPSGASGQAH